MRYKWQPNTALRKSIRKEQHNTMVRARLDQPGWSRKEMLRKGYRRVKIRGRLIAINSSSIITQ